MPSKQNTKKIDEWKAVNTERITINARKNLRLVERIAAAVAAGKAKSRQEYIIAAVDAKLTEDGFPCER